MRVARATWLFVNVSGALWLATLLSGNFSSADLLVSGAVLTAGLVGTAVAFRQPQSHWGSQSAALALLSLFVILGVVRARDQFSGFVLLALLLTLVASLAMSVGWMAKDRGSRSSFG